MIEAADLRSFKNIKKDGLRKGKLSSIQNASIIVLREVRNASRSQRRSISFLSRPEALQSSMELLSFSTIY